MALPMTIRMLGLMLFGFVWAYQASLAQTSPSLSVVTSLPPLESLAKELVRGTPIKVELLQNGRQSPHGRQYSPQEITQLKQSSALFWIGPELEPGLARLINSLALGAKAQAMLSTKVGLVLYPYQTNDPHQKQTQTLLDPHIWLDPHNAVIMLGIMKDSLAKQLSDGPSLARLNDNLAKINQRLDEEDRKIAKSLLPLGKLNFIVWHDGFQYWAKRYQLPLLATILEEPELGVKPATLKNLAKLVKSSPQPVCLVTEKEFPSQLGQQLAKDWQVPVVEIDTLGLTSLPREGGSYFTLIDWLTQSLLSCLSS